MSGKLIKRIPISSIKKDALNVVELGEDRRIIVLYDGAEYKVVEDVCPHMGGPVSRGQICKTSRTLTCPWHGYKFCLRTLALKENPNEKTWIAPLAGSEAEKYKTPRYRLKRCAHRIQSGNIEVKR